MSAYTGNVQSMTEKELLDALEDLAAEWTRDPHKPAEQVASARLGEIEEAMELRFKNKKTVRGVPQGSTSYKVVSG